MKRVSIKDIAREAGVVPSTVSLVLNGKAKEQRISDELASKIKAIAAATGYRPLQTAISLRTGSSKTLGLIVEDISNVFFATLAKAIEEEAYSRGYKIVYCSTENNDEKARELIGMLTDQQVDGYLITPSPGLDKEIGRLIARKKPVVLMDRHFPALAVPSIMVDNFGGVNLGMRHLIEKGYRRIAFVTVDLQQVQMLERERGYRAVLQQTGIQVDEELIVKLPYKHNQEQWVAELVRFLKKNPDIDAVFFATNYLGIGGLEAMQQLGKSIPGDLAVVCFDDHDIFRLYGSGISIIRQPIADIARAAIHLLLKQLETDEEVLPIQYLKDAEMIVRGST